MSKYNTYFETQVKMGGGGMVLLFQLGAGWSFQLSVREVDMTLGTYQVNMKIKMNTNIHSINAQMKGTISLFSLPK